MILTISDQHKYRVDGRVVRSVTQIIGDAGLDPNKNFYNDTACERGSNIHTITEDLDRGQPASIPILDEYRGYLKAYEMFNKFNRPVWNIDGIEQAFYNDELDYCGCLDRAGTMLWGRKRVNVCLDIKTGIKCGWHGVQLAGYAMKKRYKWERFGLYLKANGKFELKHYTNDGDFETFIKIAKGE